MSRAAAVATSVLGVLLLVSCSVTPAPPAPTGPVLPDSEPRVRVRLVEADPEVVIRVDGPVMLVPGAVGPGVPLDVLRGQAFGANDLPSGTDLKVTAAGGRITLHGADRGPAVTVVPSEPAALTVNGRRYRGALILTAVRGDDVRAVNVLGMEDYIAGIREMPFRWDADAVRAQLIAARTYALHRLLTMRNRADDRGWDVASGTADQVYRGVFTEEESDGVSRRLARETAGIVLLWDDQVLVSQYHSTCGGATDRRDKIFPHLGPAPPPLRGTTCAYCRPSRWYRWSTESMDQEPLSPAALRTRLDKVGVRVGDVATIEPVDPEPSGHASLVRITGTDGRSQTFPASRFRLEVAGPERLRSTNFTAQRTSRGWTFAGAGWGHGVGMCQYGAKGQADAGRSAVEILRHYYPGADIVRLWGANPAR